MYQVYYLLLYLPIMTLLSYNFCKSGIQAPLSWILQLRVSHKVAVKVAAKAALLLRFDWSMTHFQAHLCGWWTEGLSSSMAFEQGPLLILAMWVSQKGHARHGHWILSEQQVRKQKRACKMQVTVFHDPTLEINSSTLECSHPSRGDELKVRLLEWILTQCNLSL